MSRHTIQRDGDALGQNVAIGSHKRRDLSQWIDLQELFVPLWILVFLGEHNL